jgi:S1-C subfamily serine protease
MANRKIQLTLVGAAILLSAVAIHQTVTATHRADDSYSHLRAITVKILAGNNSIGSGTIWQSSNGNSRVVTNSHVLNASKQPFFIQTDDGKVHPANIVTPANWAKLDLAALQFYASQNYPTAKIDRRFKPQVGETVLAAGFPQLQKSPMPTPVVIEKGAITHVLSKPLAEGYQVGYSSAVAKGMSGGPLVDQRGVLVGINGMHAQPLWEGGETFADGTVVTEPLLSQISTASWAIPVERLD